MSVCTNESSWLPGFVIVVTNAGDFGLLLWPSTVTTMTRMTTTTTAMSIATTITTDTDTMAISSVEAVKIQKSYFNVATPAKSQRQHNIM